MKFPFKSYSFKISNPKDILHKPFISVPIGATTQKEACSIIEHRYPKDAGFEHELIVN